jgi:hypothetical protein
MDGSHSDAGDTGLNGVKKLGELPGYSICVHLLDEVGCFRCRISLPYAEYKIASGGIGKRADILQEFFARSDLVARERALEFQRRRLRPMLRAHGRPERLVYIV